MNLQCDFSAPLTGWILNFWLPGMFNDTFSGPQERHCNTQVFRGLDQTKSEKICRQVEGKWEATDKAEQAHNLEEVPDVNASEMIH